VRESPTETEQPIEELARIRRIRDVAPRGRAVHAAEHLARFAMRDLERATLVTRNASLPLREI
jgi:hypothetical protein